MTSAAMSDWGTEHIYESETAGGDITACIGPREEIVRCRDCVHYREERMADAGVSHRCSGVFAFVECRPDGFCAWAKRRKPCESDWTHDSCW